MKVVFISDSSIQRLTKYKTYSVLEKSLIHGYYLIMNDYDVLCHYKKSDFISLGEHRKNQILSIYSSESIL